MHFKDYSLSHYIYDVPPTAIAQAPVSPRDASRLLVVNRGQGIVCDTQFSAIDNFLKPGDLLVFNDTRVIPSRLIGSRLSKVGGKDAGYAKKGLGRAQVEVLLVKEKAFGLWEALVKPGKRAQLGDTIVFSNKEVRAEVVERTDYGGRLLKFFPPEVDMWLSHIGKPPTPPYIKSAVNDADKYQTVYACKDGAIAAPTAGFHFTPQLLNQLCAQGVQTVFITLHCGLGTFRPVKTADIRSHSMFAERVELSEQSAVVINRAKREGRRVIAVGTTVVRVLESLACQEQDCWSVSPFAGEVNLYILPGYQFKIVDGLVTNFHTPASTNLVLAATFCGYECLMRAYHHALSRNYRFFSFGDAMFIFTQ